MNSSAMELWGRRGGKKRITRADRGREGTSPGINRQRRRQKRKFNYPTQLWRSKHTGVHQVAQVTNTHVIRF